jgi:transposase
MDTVMPSVEELYARVQEMAAELAVLKTENAWLKRQLFGGGKSEKLDRLQTSLPLEVPLAEPVAPATATVTYERRSVTAEKRPVAAELFKDLPIKETLVIDPPEVLAQPEAFERIGEERTFEVDVVSPQLLKREIVRPKYRRKGDRGAPPVVAPAPARPVPGGYASAGLLAWIALSKYVDHQPLYRLEQQSQRWGARLPRQSMADWIRIAAEWLEPVYRRMHQRLLAGPYLQADETASSRACPT